MNQPTTPQTGRDINVPTKTWRKRFREVCKELFFNILGDMRYITDETDLSTGNISSIELDKQQLHDEFRKGLESFIQLTIKQELKKERERIIDLREKYKQYYNPIGDDFNKGKHVAMNDLITELENL